MALGGGRDIAASIPGAFAIVSAVEFLLTGQEMRVEVRYPSTDVDPADYTLSDWGTT